ncbi:SDR family oxidoreductase [Nocardia amikacinitolerans]|uniref:SDR family oxidoreductase n=1 Tax=Nocardia amikacinitolerans TaxID=756689 RepID=UPI0020A4AA14|nr:SDR family oxidoreductase [Nocardia amikacinitolerans]MCP2288165.1 Short-chain dehydrogenase [Nocardia amikacinitolerans]
MAHTELKPIREQVVVVAGASSGIGRDTALRFAEAGAKVVVAARSAKGLASLVEEIAERGGEAVHAVCDVSERDQVEAVADLAISAYGRIDTWVAVAAVVVYAGFEDTTPEEFRRVMEVNFMGQVHGMQVALPHLRREGRGALVSVGSGETVVAMPLNSAYAASKHAVEGMLDALRRELMAEGTPISVTSIKPAAINTPFFTNGRNKMGVKPKGAPPFYDPSVVADCALYAATRPVRDLYAGDAARMMKLGQHLAPGMVDLVLAKFGIPMEQTDEPVIEPGGNLYGPSGDARVQGDFGDQAMPFSPYTWLATHPKARKLFAVGALGAAGVLLARRTNGSTDLAR